jgi:hypothetical protein
MHIIDLLQSMIGIEINFFFCIGANIQFQAEM